MHFGLKMLASGDYFNALILISQSRDLLGRMGGLASTAAEIWTWKGSAEKLKRSLEAGFENSIPGSESKSRDWIINRR